jgi:hypothetical protein
MDRADTEAIDDILGPLAARHRGFVLGLLLTRGQAQRDAVAATVTGRAGFLCRQAVRDANELSREGRLQLIRRLASEVLGFAPPHGEAVFSRERLSAILQGESDGVLAALAQQGGDPLGEAAESILVSRGVTTGFTPATTNELRVELRRAVVSALEASDVTAEPATPRS